MKPLSALNMIAQIELRPSFHDAHTWTVAIDADSANAEGKTNGSSGRWQLDNAELHAVPDELRTGSFPDDNYDEMGLDGITVRFQIETDSATRQKEIWCPESSRCGAYAILVRWCWNGLYTHSNNDYRVRLEQLHSYFHDWGINVRQTPDGLRLFGMFSSTDEDQLNTLFDNVAAMPEPVIDMTNFENTGTLLYPVFKQFFTRAPKSRWLVNQTAYNHMCAAGIPDTSMTLTQTESGR